LEVRRSGDGHPPFTEREREIHLNGTSGVKILRRLGSIVDPGLFLFFAMENANLPPPWLGSDAASAERPTLNASIQNGFSVER
jgi:hypothetical protein